MAVITITTTGLIGNLSVLYVLSHKQFIKELIFRYLFLVTVLDLINLLPIWLSIHGDYFQINKYSARCKWSSYIFNVIDSSIPWIVLLSSFERYLQVYYPNKLMFRNKLKYQILLIAILACCMLLINLPSYFYVDAIYFSNATLCSFISHSSFSTFGLDFYFSLYAVLVPCILMFVSTSLINRKLVQKNLPQISQKKFDKNKHLIRMLIGMDLFFLVCNLPPAIVSCTSDLLPAVHFSSLTLNLVNHLTYVFHSCNFFVYFFCNNLFRKYFYSIFKKKSKISTIT